MNATLTEEQKMLRDAARELLEARYPMSRVAEIADGAGFERASWSELAELGWTAISVPEHLGGVGLGVVDEAVLIEELGRVLFPGPFFASAVLATVAAGSDEPSLERLLDGSALGTLAWAGDEDVFDARRPAVTATRDGNAWHLDGAAAFVPDLALADLVFVAASTPAGPGLWAVAPDGAGTRATTAQPLDPTRPLGRIELERAPARLVAEPGTAVDELLGRVRDRACVALAAECVGIISRVVEISVEYATVREQYGRPIGSFQAVAHRLADAFVEGESARSLTYWAAWSVNEGMPDATLAASSAKAFAGEAAVRAVQSAIQVHGGVGFTWEHPLHRFYRRALWCAAYMGWPATHRARVAAALLDEGGS